MTPTEQSMLELLREVAENSPITPTLMVRVREMVEQYDGQAEDEFRRLAPLVGADPDWWNKMFKSGRKFLTVRGINPGRPKNPMSICDTVGKVFKCMVGYVRTGMPAAAPEPRRRTRGGRNLDLGE